MEERTPITRVTILVVVVAVAVFGIGAGAALAGDGKKKMSVADVTALIDKMVAVGKIDAGTAAKKKQALQKK